MLTWCAGVPSPDRNSDVEDVATRFGGRPTRRTSSRRMRIVIEDELALLLDDGAAQPNDRPRQTLGRKSPSQALDEVLR